MAEKVWLPDVNVWIALAASKHEHHTAAHKWFELTAEGICFCRVTQMYRELLSDSRVRFLSEAGGIEKLWHKFMGVPQIALNSWTDAYLAALAIEARLRFVSFDKGMRKWEGLALELLSPSAID